MKERKSYWKVSTAGDAEYRTNKYLGIYEGDVVDIAFALAEKEVFELVFERVYPVEVKEFKPTANEVNVRISDFDYSKAKKLLSKNSRDVVIGECNIYRAVNLKLSTKEQSEADKARKLLEENDIDVDTIKHYL